MSLRHAAYALLTGLGYYASARLGAAHAVMPGAVTLVWPPVALLLAVLIVVPRKAWWPYLLAAVAAECAADLPLYPLGQTLVFACVGVGEAVASALVLRAACRPDPPFDSLRYLVRFIVLVVFGTSGASAVAGAAALVLFSPNHLDFLSIWRFWWFSDGLGMLLLVPFVVGWLTPLPNARVYYSRYRALEILVIAVLTVASTFLVFHPESLGARIRFISPFMLLVFPLWSGVRFGVRGASTTCVFLAAYILLHTVQDMGPFVVRDERETMLKVQEFLLVAAAVSLFVGMMLRELHQKNLELSLKDQAINATTEGVLIVDARSPELPVVFVNRAYEAMAGFASDEVLGHTCRLLQHDGAGNESLGSLCEGARESRNVRVVLRSEKPDGAPVWNEMNIAPVEDEQGDIAYYVGVQHDVTELKNNETRLLEAQKELRQLNAALEARVVERTRELERANARLVQLATTDSLTGIANRRHFMQQAELELGRAKRYGKHLSLIMFDIDHFKAVNDTHGHQVGDSVLKNLARWVAEALRPSDILGRLGGEEFAVVLAETDLAGAAALAERIRVKVASMRTPAETEPVSVTVSLGVHQFDIAGESVDDALNKADINLYKAKQSGRNRVVAA
ncbi:MAG: diguanylate cyclase [Desulfovibrionaceae bacterium]